MAMQFFRPLSHMHTQPYKMETIVAPENPATAIDRDYIAAERLLGNAWQDVTSYDRAPVAGEWAMPVPDEAFVRVFVINEYTAVRALQTASGIRIAEPVIDTWRSAATSVALP